MAAITKKKRRDSHKQELKNGALTDNEASKGLVKDEAEKSDDLFAALVCGFTILILLMALLSSY